MSYKSEQVKRRIEEIKGKALKDKVQFQNIRTRENGWVNTYTLTEDDFNFLVEKVELVEELEQQNEHYREAIEETLQAMGMVDRQKYGKTLERVLEVEE